MNQFSFADTVSTGHYLTANAPNHQQVVASILVPICVPNGKVIRSTHSAQLDLPSLPTSTQQTYISPYLHRSLLSIGTLCGHGCRVIFEKDSVVVEDCCTHNVLLQDPCCPQLGLYLLFLSNPTSVMTESLTLENFVRSVYNYKSKQDLIWYFHAACWSPTIFGWKKQSMPISSSPGWDSILHRSPNISQRWKPPSWVPCGNHIREIAQCNQP